MRTGGCLWPPTTRKGVPARTAGDVRGENSSLRRLSAHTETGSFDAAGCSRSRGFRDLGSFTTQTTQDRTADPDNACPVIFISSICQSLTRTGPSSP